MNRIPAHIELHKQPLDSGKSNPEKKYASIVKILAKNNGVVQPIGKKGFGRTGLYFNGRLFAFLSHKKQLVVKLGPKRVMVLVAEDKGIYWDPKRDGPVLKSLRSNC